LGDGCLAKHGNYHRLHIKHKLAQLALVEMKHEAFRDFVTMPLHEFDQQLRGRAYPCVQFATRTSPVFSEWHSRFYLDGRKIIPKDIASCLSPLAMAVWFMDDGAADYAGVTIQTHNFQPEEVEFMRSLLSEMFGLRGVQGVTRERGSCIWRLRVLIDSRASLDLTCFTNSATNWSQDGFVTP
jgi:hypothetical protein